MSRITAKDFAAKYRDKQEVYHFLSHDVGAYLSSYDSMTVWHMRDIMSGQRRMIKGTDVKHLSVPQYEDLTINKFLEFAQGYDTVMQALPSEFKECKKLPRQYLINVVYTIVGQPFRQWVNDKVDERHAAVVEKRDLTILMDPQIAAVYNQSKAVSTNQGASYNLLKATAKRRRSKAQIEEEKREEQVRQADINQKMQQFAQMEQRLQQMEAELQNQQHNQDQVNEAQSVVQKLENAGLLKKNEDGNYQGIDNWEEHQHILQQRQEDQQLAQELQQQNQQLQQHQPHADRRRASNFLEVINDFNMNKNNEMAESMIVVDEKEEVDNQIQRSQEDVFK